MTRPPTLPGPSGDVTRALLRLLGRVALCQVAVGTAGAAWHWHGAVRAALALLGSAWLVLGTRALLAPPPPDPPPPPGDGPFR
jgi:hypothetical protein